MAKLTELRPMLIANDLTETIGFYTSRLGFECIGMWGHNMDKPTWCQLERDGVKLMFTRTDTEPHDHGDGVMHAHEAVAPALAGSIYIDVEDVDGLFEELRPKVETFEWEPETFEYGMREFALRDCNGYHLIFGAPTD